MKEDNVTSAIASDELVITYANLQILKYSHSKHHHKMIRNKLRHISRILLEMRKLNEQITDVASIFDPSHFDCYVEAIHRLAGLRNGKFRVPSFGPSSVTLINQIGDVLEGEAIKRKSRVVEENTKRFLKLVTTSANALINKTAIENRTQIQRTVDVTLPKTKDIEHLSLLLEKEAERNVNILKQNFNLTVWLELNKLLLVKIMTFNRKRPGDVEKSQIVEFKNIKFFGGR